MSLTYDDADQYVERIEHRAGDWTLTVDRGRPGYVRASSPGQEFECDRVDGSVAIEVSDGERASPFSFNGDLAGTRYIPIDVLEAAIRVWRASLTPPPTPGA